MISKKICVLVFINNQQGSKLTFYQLARRQVILNVYSHVEVPACPKQIDTISLEVVSLQKKL